MHRNLAFLAFRNNPYGWESSVRERRQGESEVRLFVGNERGMYGERSTVWERGTPRRTNHKLMQDFYNMRNDSISSRTAPLKRSSTGTAEYRQQAPKRILFTKTYQHLFEFKIRCSTYVEETLNHFDSSECAPCKQQSLQRFYAVLGCWT